MQKKVCEGIISSKFGMRVHPITKIKKLHNGVDIACKIGTEVFSPVAAIVAQIYENAAGGKVIILRDVINNDRYAFCHLSEQLVKSGTRIAKGSIIAKTGNTGLSTGPHLHFSYATGGYWKDGICKEFTYLDPTKKIIFEI